MFVSGNVESTVAWWLLGFICVNENVVGLGSVATIGVTNKQLN